MSVYLSLAVLLLGLTPTQQIAPCEGNAMATPAPITKGPTTTLVTQLKAVGALTEALRGHPGAGDPRACLWVLVVVPPGALPAQGPDLGPALWGAGPLC